MRRNSKLLVATTALLAVALLVWFYAARTLRHADASRATLSGANRNLAAEIRRIEGRVAAADRLRTELSQTLVSLGPLKPTSVSAQAYTSAPRLRTMSDLIANHPDLEVLELNRRRAAVLLDYGDFFRARGLSPAQIGKFTDNYVKGAEQDMDLRAAARAQDEAGKQTVAALQQRAKSEYEAAQSEVLGPDGYRQLEEHIRTVPLQNIVVRGLAGAAALDGIPLTAEQGAQLVQAAIRASGPDAKADGEQSLRTIDWTALDAQARQILSPAQFALFTTVAPPSGFQSRWSYQLDAAIRRAQQADAANTATKSSGP